MSLHRKLNVKIFLMFIVAENTGSVNIFIYCAYIQLLTSDQGIKICVMYLWTRAVYIRSVVLINWVYLPVIEFYVIQGPIQVVVLKRYMYHIHVSF